MEKIKKIKKEWRNLIVKALYELRSAVDELIRPTFPPTPEPRPHLFKITDSATWPKIGKKINWRAIKTEEDFYWIDTDSEREEAAEVICEQLNWNPKLILRALRRIRAAAEWCRRRAEGRKKATKEIMKQREKYVTTLRAEAALEKLKE